MLEPIALPESDTKQQLKSDFCVQLDLVQDLRGVTKIQGLEILPWGQNDIITLLVRPGKL